MTDFKDDVEEPIDDESNGDFEEEFEREHAKKFNQEYEPGDLNADLSHVLSEWGVDLSLLRKGIIETLGITDAEDYFGQLLGAIDSALDVKGIRRDLDLQHLVYSPNLSDATNRRRIRKLKQNGHRKSSHEEQHNGHHVQVDRSLAHHQPANLLKIYSVMVARYARLGMNVSVVLEDTVNLFADIGTKPMALILAGLTARRVVAPSLECGDSSVDLAWCAKLMRACERSLQLLNDQQCLQALPALAKRVGANSSGSQKSALKFLPQRLYRAASKVVENPVLAQHLSEEREDGPSFSPTRRTQKSVHLQVEAPLEIVIRYPGEF
ncbi:MAG: hypothetical protein AB4050_13330 [Synechococcus sp.]